MPQTLEGIRVLDLGHHVAGPYCTKLMAGFGAEVIKVERPGVGDPSRALGPFPGDAPDPEKSAAFLFLNTGKKSLTLDLKSASGKRTLKELVAEADVLVENFAPRVMPALGLDYSTLEKLNPGLVMASISNFGQTGPYRDYKADDMVEFALSGIMNLHGYRDREPLSGVEYQPEYQGGLNAFSAVMAALYWRQQSGEGQYVDISIHECMSQEHEYDLTVFTHLGVVTRRIGNRFDVEHPFTVYPCADGHVSVNGNPAVAEDPLYTLVERPDLLDDPRFRAPQDRVANYAEFDAELMPWFAEHKQQEIFETGQGMGALMAPVNELGDAMADRHYRARGFWREITHPKAGTLTYPGPPFTGEGSSWRGGSAPLLGEHDEEIASAPRVEKRRAIEVRPKDTGAGEQPLAGVRIVDLTRFWAGPLGTRVLADMGAEVIRVEDPRHSRRFSTASGIYPDGEPGDEPWNRSGNYNDWNRNKLSITLDLQNERGRELFLELIAVSDAVVDNFSPAAMRKFDLTYPVLREVNPRLIMVSASGFGARGPFSSFKSFGTISEAYSGMWSLHGYEGEAPLLLGSNYSDPAVSMSIAAAVTLALLHQRNTGEGQYFDLAQCEALACLLGHAYVGCSATGKQPPRRGNRKPGFAPHGCYPCRGEDAWAVIAVGEGEWPVFCEAIGSPAWTREERFATAAGREQHADALDKLVAEWTRGRGAYELMHALQEAGVAAAPVLTSEGLLADPHLKERGFFWDVSHPKAGTFPNARLPQRFSRTPAVLRRPAPCLGEHNPQILGGLLGCSKEELAELEAQGVIHSSLKPA